MNIVNLRFPNLMEQFGEAVAHLIATYQTQAPEVHLDWIRERAGKDEYATIALTDSRWRVIAFGCMKVGKDTNNDTVEAIVVDPDHGQSGNVNDDISHNLTSEAWNRRSAYTRTRERVTV